MEDMILAQEKYLQETLQSMPTPMTIDFLVKLSTAAEAARDAVKPRNVRNFWRRTEEQEKIATKTIENSRFIVKMYNKFNESDDKLSMQAIECELNRGKSFSMLSKLVHALTLAEENEKASLISGEVSANAFINRMMDKHNFEIEGIELTREEQIRIGARRLKDDSEPDVDIAMIVRCIESATKDFLESLQTYKELAIKYDVHGGQIKTVRVDYALQDIAKAFKSLKKVIV